MAFRGKIQLTEQGKALLAAAQIGGRLSYVRFVLGDGMPMESTPSHVVSPRVAVPISSAVRDQRNQIILTGMFRNTQIAEDFTWREFGLYATGDTEATQILYAYGVTEEGDLIPAGDNVDLVEMMLRYTARIDNAPNVSLIVDSTVLGITLSQLRAEIHGMLREVSRQSLSIGAGGWTEGEDGIFRKTIPLAGASISSDRHVWLDIPEPWEGAIGLMGGTMGENTLTLRTDEEPEGAFGLDAFLFEVYRNPEVI